MGATGQLSDVLVVLCIISAVFAPVYGDGGPETLGLLEVIEVGPADLRNQGGAAFDVPGLPGNVAQRADAVAFGSRSDFTSLHDTLIDGLYEGTWRGNTGTDSTAVGGVLESCGYVNCVNPNAIPGGLECSYVGIYWTNGPVTVAEIALGSNNRNTGAITQRNYVIQYTMAIFAPVALAPECVDDLPTPCDDSANYTGVTWITIGKAGGHILGPAAELTLRHRYKIDPPLTGVRAIRVLKVENDDIDEIEVGNAPNTLGPAPPPGLLLTETGGPYTTLAASGDVPTAAESNVARDADAVAFASSQTDVANLTDGNYGTAWVGANGPSTGITYAGIYFQNGEKTIGQIAISRDNTGALNDLTTGIHTLEVTSDTFDPSSDASVGGANWTRPTKHLAGAHLDAAAASRGLRHRYVLTVRANVRAIRVVTAAGNAFDELEAGPIIAADLDSALTPLAAFNFLGTGPKTPPFQVPSLENGNLARAPDAVPFASLTRAGHAVDKLNNGLYGDSEGWNAVNGAVTTPRSYAAYAGIYWTNGLKTIGEVVVGRDNKGGHSNRHDGAFAVHYTTDELDFVNAGEDEPAVAAAKWIAIGTLRSHPLGVPSEPLGEQFTDLLRHLYELVTPVEARAIRVSAWPAGRATHVDELEIFGPRSETETNCSDSVDNDGDSDTDCADSDCDATPACQGDGQLAGDCNQDGTVDLSDAVCLLGHLFHGNPSSLPCTTTPANLALMDCNNDGDIDLSDAAFKLAFLFLAGPPPVQGVVCFSIADCPQNQGCP